MNRWDRERADHVFENTVERPGPIIRSRALPAASGDDRLAQEPGQVDAVRCPICGDELPGVAAACPRDGTVFA